MPSGESYWRYSIQIDSRVWEFTERTLGDCLLKIGEILNRQQAEPLAPPNASTGYDEYRVQVRRWSP